MGLLPLEFTDGLTDSPDFRETLQAHERELDLTNTAIKHLIKDIKDLIAAAKNLSRAQRTLSDTLSNFNFECIGSSQTDDEMVIANSFKDFARLLSTIEDERDRLLEKADEAFLEPIERFRREQIGSAKEAKKKFEKETAKYCQNLERFLNLSGKKNETQLAEADALNSLEQQHFFKAMSEYVLKLQEVNERKKFEFVETVLSFMLGWLTFYHQGHEIATDFYSVKMELQMRLQRTRNNFNMTQEETKSLRQKMLNNQEKFKKKFQDFSDETYSRQGYLFLMEKKAFTTSWTKHFCKFEKNSRKLFITPFTQTMGKCISKDDKTYIVVKECIKRSQDTIDRRFCFDIVAGPEDKLSTGTNAHSNSGHFHHHHHHHHSNVVATNGPTKSSSHSPNIFSSSSSSENTNNVIYTFQALSEEDYKGWLETLEARDPQPVSNNPKTGKLSFKNNDNAKNHSTNDGGIGSSSTVHHNLNDTYELDAQGYWFVKKCIQSIESKGLDQKGIYRVVGVTSRVRTLMEMFSQSKSKSANVNHNAVENDYDLDNSSGKASSSDQNCLNLDDNDLLPGFDVDSDEFETKTITSALKSYLRNLVEPIMTFELHNAFISAAKLENRNLRIEKIHQLVHRLPPINFKILKILIQHLQKVAKMHDKNLMTFSNLGVCFGPTLLRTAEESVAAILDIKFVNVIAELLIENYEKFFLSKPSASTEDSASGNQTFYSQIQQRPLPNVPAQMPQQNPYGTSGMIVRNMVSPQSQTTMAEAVPNFNRFMTFNNNANNNHSNSGHDQFYTIPLSSTAIPLSSRNRSAAYNSPNNGLLQQSTTSNLGPMLHSQHSKQTNQQQQQQYSPLNYSTYHTIQQNPGGTNMAVANTASSVAASRRPLRLSLSSSSSPSPSLGSTALSTMANQNSTQNLSIYPSQVIGKQQTTSPSQPIPSTNSDLFNNQARSGKVIGHHVQHLYPQTQQLPQIQPSYSFQNLHYNVEMSGTTAALNCNQISPGSGLDCKNRCLPSNSNHLIHNRPMTSIGIIPPNSTYASLLRSDNYNAEIMQPAQKKIDPLAKLNLSANANVSNSSASYGTSSLQTRPINFSSSSSISLPSTPEHPTQQPITQPQQQQQLFTYNKSSISNVVPNTGAKQTTTATQLILNRNSQSSNIDSSTMQQPTTSSCIEQQQQQQHHPSSPSSSLITESSYPSNVYQQIAKSGQSIYGSIFGTSSLAHPQHRSGAIPSQALPSTKVRTRFVCIGGSESELSFQPNTIITNVRTSREPGWLEGNLNGKTGLIPLNYVEFIE